MKTRRHEPLTLAVITALFAVSCATTRGPAATSEEPLASEAAARRATDSASGGFEDQPLLATPTCEASAALVAPWDDNLVLVADNEAHKQLFGFSLESGRLAPDETLAMPAGGRPRDLEAIARVGNSILIVGSHSRNSGCEPRSNRQRMRMLSSRKDGSLEDEGRIDSEKAWSRAVAGESECLETLFDDPAPELAPAVCNALLAAEAAAASGESCPVLNIEGAFGTEEGRVWLGLRAPLAEGSAILLRLTADLEEFRFDRVALLPLAGRGIRELAVGGDSLYGIAGPQEDAKDDFALFTADLETIQLGGRVSAEIVRQDLLTSSEGMFIHDGHANIIVDGDEGEDDADGVCEKSSHQYRVELP